MFRSTSSITALAALAALPCATRAHDGLRLDGPLHHALHAIGAQPLAALAGLTVAIGVGLAARRVARTRPARGTRATR